MKDFKNYLLEYETHTDSEGHRWNDEGERYERPPRHPEVHNPKLHYHYVDPKRRKEAEHEGMKPTSDHKIWTHSSHEASAKSKFGKIS